MFHLLIRPLLPGPRGPRLRQLDALSETVSAASRMLNPNLRPPADAPRELNGLEHEAIRLRRELENRLARAGVHLSDPRLVCDAASEMVEVMRLITRAVRCRAWLGLDPVPAEVLELEAVAGQGVQLVALAARRLATSGAQRVDRELTESIKRRAEELYSRGVSRAFADSPDPLDVLRQKTVYDALLSLITGCNRALESLRDASFD